jgi:hypothetical protein
MLFTFGAFGFVGFFFGECCTIIGEKSLVLPFFALLDRVRCATCVSNSRVALANVLRPLCLFLISLYLHQSFFFFSDTRKSKC